MKRSVAIAICALAILPIAARAGEIIDGVVATVNRKPVLHSEWDEATRFEEFMQQKPLSAVSESDRVRALQRLIDRRLIEAEMAGAGFMAPTRDELRADVAKLRAQVPAAKDDKGWQALLTSYGLNERNIEDHLRSETQMMNFIDARLRPNIHVQPEEVEEYYRAQLLPDLEKSGVKVLSLQEVEPRIRELLMQQRIGDLLEAWLHNLRQQSAVHSNVPLPSGNSIKDGVGES
jgi:hypothetical protein